MLRNRMASAGDPGVATSTVRRLAALLAALSVAATASANPPPAAQATVPPQPASHTQIGGTLDHRLKVLTKALDLDERQQVQLRTILEEQREAVLKIWRDTKLLPAERAPATHAVADRTADRIRAILNDEQKAKYNPPKPPPAPTPESGAPNVEAWLKAERAK